MAHQPGGETEPVYSKDTAQVGVSSDNQISILNSLMFLLTALLAAYLISEGVDGFNPLAIACYTIAFGVLLMACLS